MNQHVINPFTIALAAILAITMLHACEDSMSVKDTPPPTDIQTPGPAQQELHAGQQADPSGIIEGEYIVQFEEQWDGQISEQIGRQADQLREEIFSDHSVHPDSVLNRYRYAYKGFAAKLSDEQVETLRNDPRIARVEPNIILRLGISNTAILDRSIEKETTISNSVSEQQAGHWGVARVGGPLDGTGRTAWILDSGIELNHPDLNVDVDNSASFIANESANDIVGHGTHVAGIVAATGNTTNVVGVASGANVVAIKVCNSLPPHDPNHGCPVNSVVNGVDYVSIRAQPEDIVNLSLGGHDPNEQITAVDQAIENAANTGIRFAISAGNDRVPAEEFTPARVVHQNVRTVSAFREGDEFVQVFDWNTPNCNPGQNPNEGSSFWHSTN